MLQKLFTKENLRKLFLNYFVFSLFILNFYFQGHFIEVQVTDGALYRTKIHCYFLDQTRVVRSLPEEKNYHIFYQMLAGLTQEERGEKGGANKKN